jgi:hypothetical protein
MRWIRLTVKKCSMTKKRADSTKSGSGPSRLLKKSLSYGFEHSVVAEVERDLNLEGAVVTEFG